MLEKNYSLYNNTLAKHINLSSVAEEPIVYKENKDKRIEWVTNFFGENLYGNYLWLKVCRSGATSAFVAVSLDKHEKFCLFSPTNKIGQETVKNAIKYSNRDPDTVKIRHVLTNHECPINKEKIKECPDFAELPYLLLPCKCEECDREDCVNKEIICDDSIDGLTMTYDKIVNINYVKYIKPNATAGKIFNRISEAKNLLFDEVHDLQFGKVKGITVFTENLNKEDKKSNNINLDKYNSIPDKFKYVNAVVTRFHELINDKRYNIIFSSLLSEAKKFHFKKHLSDSFRNPIMRLLNNYSDIIITKDKNEVMNGFYNDIISITIERKKHNLDMDSIKKLYSMLSICTNEDISINAIHVKGSIHINISVADLEYTETIKKFLSEMEGKDKRIVLTSGTLCSYNYQQLFKEKLNTIKFCGTGDPLNTNENMLVLTDNKTYSSIGKKATIKTELNEIVSNIESVLDFYGKDDVLIITANKVSEVKIRQELKERHRNDVNITYYGSVDLIGVACDARVCVTVGLGNIPVNTYDYITFNKFLSAIMRKEREHCTVFQGWNRVKDSHSNEKSVIIGLYCKTKECENILTWGSKRTVNIVDDNSGNIEETYVTCDEPLPQAQIKECGSFEEMLIEANNWRYAKNTGEETNRVLMKVNERRLQTKVVNNKNQKPTKPSTRNHLQVQNFKNKTIIIENKYELLRLLNKGKKAYIISKNGDRMPIRDIPLMNNLIDNHFNGEIELELFLLNENSLATCMAFGFHYDDNYSLVKLCKCLDLMNIPMILERINDNEYKYKVWIPLEKVSGNLVQELGKYIKALADVECDILPKHGLIKTGRKNSDSTKFPLSNNSEIMINGQWVKDFRNLEVKVLDITGCELLKPQLC